MASFYSHTLTGASRRFRPVPPTSFRAAAATASCPGRRRCCCCCCCVSGLLPDRQGLLRLLLPPLLLIGAASLLLLWRGAQERRCWQGALAPPCIALSMAKDAFLDSKASAGAPRCFHLWTSKSTPASRCRQFGKLVGPARQSLAVLWAGQLAQVAEGGCGGAHARRARGWRQQAAEVKGRRDASGQEEPRSLGLS